MRKRLVAAAFGDRSALIRRKPEDRFLPRVSTIARILLVLLVAAGVVAAVVFRDSFQPLAIKAHISEYEFAPLIFIAALVAASLVFVPRTLLAAAGGLLFGLWWGLLWTMIGSTVGAVLGFLLARYVNAGLVDAATMPRLAPLLKAAERGGWRIVALLRLLPLPHTPVNYALGLTRLTLGGYTVGSVLGMLPASVVYAQLGASGDAAMGGRAWVVPTIAALALLGLTALLPRLAVVRRSLGLGTD
jgi:uncharacterized membrane protein YdjX (TVP38/TMEM64 family)